MAHTPASHGDPVQQIGFRVMRLAKPSLNVEEPLRLDLRADMVTDAVAGSTKREDESPFASTPFAGRVHSTESLESSGLTGAMELPQSFGTIYLGETFCCYISVVNYSEEPVGSVVLKAEVQTERQKSMLHDNTSNPVVMMPPGGRHDFIVSHDVKELGPHTLVCSAVYTSSDGERKYLPQYFKFPSQNPLSVRTKVRMVGDDTFLETCVENCTKAPLLIHYVRFNPSPHLSVTELKMPDSAVQGKETAPGEEDYIGDYLRQLQVVQPSGGMWHFLYHLQRATGAPGRSEASGNSALGKLEIRWHGAMGEVGRLQTQQIMGVPATRKELELKVVSVPGEIWLHRPFEARVLVQSHVERRMGPVKLLCTARPLGASKAETAPHAAGGGAAAATASAAESGVVVAGPQSRLIGELAAFGCAELTLTMVAVAAGVQTIDGLLVVDERDGKPYGGVNSTQVFVHAA